MTQAELFESANKIDLNWNHKSLLEALETHYLNGLADEFSGDTDAPTGHFYRVDRWIVVTNYLGDQNVLTFIDETQARRFFEIRSRRYSAWLGDDD